MQRLSATACWPVFDNEGLRTLERSLQSNSSSPLMHKAGLAAAQLALSIAPHAQRIWIAAGPGNNGGDGLEAACHLHRSGKSVIVSLLGEPEALPADPRSAWLRAIQTGVPITQHIPWNDLLSMTEEDLCIDALLGLGASRPVSMAMRSWIQAINTSKGHILALDIPTGLNPESGQLLGCEDADPQAIHAEHTLTFIAAKPGMFMGHGRDLCGQIWLDTLTDPDTTTAPQACLNPHPTARTQRHASHKGSHGDVLVIGGESLARRGMGMTGAAILAATAALHAGAGRVMLHLLDDAPCTGIPSDVMRRDWSSVSLDTQSVVCGCGGGEAVINVMSDVLQRSARLVLDADALNAMAKDTHLQCLLQQRLAHQPTVITPHPLEAARLLKTTSSDIQNNRLKSARDLAQLFNCTVVLKGSGTVIAAPGQTPRINTTGNGKLATGGTGDVLAGLLGARLAQGMEAFAAACTAVQQHGALADEWPEHKALTASRLAHGLR
jgi:hydroxyethylthiazole kinase-like uncharacterized protein yjeF